MTPFARKRFGQHFLVDTGALQRIAAALTLGEAEPLLEIGPGRGALTAVLLDRVERLGVVELDRDLAAELSSRYPADRLRVWNEDVLQLRLESVRDELGADDRRLVVVGNLPYNISKPIAMKLIGERAAIDRAVLMFQKEVAERLTAKPGSRAYGPLAILCGEVWSVRASFDVSPGAFRPRPKVMSTVTVWARRPGPGLHPDLESRLRRVLSACFARRRQTLRNNLRAAIGERDADALLAASGLEGAVRAEMLEPSAFRGLAEIWPDPPLHDGTN